MRTFIFFLLLFVGNSFAQKEIPDIQELNYTHKDIFDSLITSYKHSGVDSMIVFLCDTLEIEKSNYADLVRNNLLTFLICKKKGTVFVILIDTCSIYYPYELPNSKIFKYPYINRTRVTREEYQLDFVDPVMGPFSAQDVVFFTPRDTFYFETGSVCTYVEDKRRLKYRLEWISLMKKEIFPLIGRFKIEDGDLCKKRRARNNI